MTIYKHASWVYETLGSKIWLEQKNQVGESIANKPQSDSRESWILA